MAAAAPQPLPLDGIAAAPAGLAGAPVDPGLTAVIAIEALEVSEIAEGGAAGADAGPEHLHKALLQVGQTIERQAATGGIGSDAGGKQAFIGIDVADAGDQ